MAGIKINGDTSGSTTITAPATGSDESIELSTALASKLDASSQKIVQVQSVTKTDVFTTTSSTFADVTGLSVSITPTSASNNILVFFSVMIADSGNTFITRARLVRDSTAIYVGDTAGSRVPAAGRVQSTSTGVYADARIAGQHLDSPATTSATTYKMQVRTQTVAGGTSLVNRSFNDTDADGISRYASSITVMEVTP